MDFRLLEIPDLILICPQVISDHRGEFLEIYREEEYAAAGIGPHFVQDNHSRSKKGVLRGLHYQIEQAQGKLIYVSSGKIFDVAVDLRRNSRTFKQWVGVELDSKNRQQLWIPPGFAHGFFVLSEWAEVSYKVTNLYAPQHERTLAWNDPELDINWPLEDPEHPILSENDASGALFPDVEVYG